MCWSLEYKISCWTDLYKILVCQDVPDSDCDDWCKWSCKKSYFFSGKCLKPGFLSQTHNRCSSDSKTDRPFKHL